MVLEKSLSFKIWQEQLFNTTDFEQMEDNLRHQRVFFNS